MRWFKSFDLTVRLERLYSNVVPPIGNEGELAPSDHKFGAVLRDQALVHHPNSLTLGMKELFSLAALEWMGELHILVIGAVLLRGQ